MELGAKKEEAHDADALILVVFVVIRRSAEEMILLTDFADQSLVQKRLRNRLDLPKTRAVVHLDVLDVASVLEHDVGRRVCLRRQAHVRRRLIRLSGGVDGDVAVAVARPDELLAGITVASVASCEFAICSIRDEASARRWTDEDEFDRGR